MVVLAAISFFESALPVPILTDPFLVAAILLNRAQAIRLVIVTTASSVLGGVMAYVTATYFLESLLRWMTPGIVEHFERLIAGSEESTFILTLLGAITPVPYTLVAWAVAVIEGGVLVFVLASILGRGVRYGIIGYCVYRFGPLATQYAKRYIGVTSVVVVLALALLVWIKM
jgi:membrane protein YqaA with SNARE-associated domain